MFKLAWKQFQLNLWHSVLTTVAIGSIIAVILLLQGFEQGQYYQLEKIVLNRNADLIATQAGVKNFIAVRSSIPQLARSEVESVEGVLNAHPITAIPIIYTKENKSTPVYVLVHDTFGGPSSILEGHSSIEGNYIVIDRSLAKKYDIKLGDKFNVTDFEFKVSGITKETAFMMPFAFINYDGMIDLFIESEIAPDISTFPLLSFLLIKIKPGFNVNDISKNIESTVPSVDIITPGELAKRDVNIGRVFFGPIIGLLVTIGYIVGVLVVGLIMYADVRSHIKSFAILKALGFSFKKLLVEVLFKTLILLFFALPIGILLAQSLTVFIQSSAPIYLIHFFNINVIVSTVLASFGFAIIGALIPLYTIYHSDPVMAFQEV
ncbi:MAG: hypothetical protein GTO02_10640 [Candidatus Dadabacteria bacterium]|nr:hypothetical protein [Candidatus Dadabacteria bacterium]NIQ14825.1 hypothetical protein [Candidatus Dadabacteria bacterium]